MGLFGSDSSVSQTFASDERIGASDSAVVQRGVGNTVTAISNYIDGGAASLIEAMSLAQDALFSGRHATQGAFDLATHTEDTIADVVRTQAALGLENRAIDTAFLETVVSQNRNLLDSTLARLSDLSETKLTGGENDQRKTILIIVGAALAFAALIILKKK